MENTRSDLVRRLFEAFFAGDRATVDALLSPDYRFSSIDDPGIDKAAYFERCWPNHERLRDVELTTVIESGDDVFVRYAATPPRRAALPQHGAHPRRRRRDHPERGVLRAAGRGLRRLTGRTGASRRRPGLGSPHGHRCQPGRAA